MGFNERYAALNRMLTQMSPEQVRRVMLASYEGIEFDPELVKAFGGLQEVRQALRTEAGLMVTARR